MPPSAWPDLIRALIVDDEPLARRAVRLELEREEGIEVVGECASGLEALAAIHARSPDLVFLDVQMPELSGIEVIRLIDSSSMPIVVFVTAYDRYAIQAFELHAIDYLLKPFDPERFQRTLGHARLQVARRNSAEVNRGLLKLLSNGTLADRFARRFVIKSIGRWWVVEADRVDWISSADNYVELHVGPEAHLLRETLSHLEARLDPETFLRVRHSTIVNIKRIKEIRPQPSGEHELELKDGTLITVSRRYRNRLSRLDQR